MAYKQPGVMLTQVFLNAQPALAADALPNINIGEAYQLVTDALFGTYSGNLQAYGYANLMGGAQVDLAETSEDEVYPATKKELEILLRDVVVAILPNQATGYAEASDLTIFKDDSVDIFANVLPGDVLKVQLVEDLQIVSAQTDGVSNTANTNRLQAGTAGQFSNVKSGDSVEVTAGTNTITGTYTVTAKISDDVIVLSGAINDGNGASSDVAYSISGDRGGQSAGDFVVKSKTDNNTLVLQSPLAEAEQPLTYSVSREIDEVQLSRVEDISLEAGFEASEDEVELPAALQASVGSNAFDILSANVIGSYRALRNDLAFALRTFTDIAEVYALFGGSDQVTPQNPLAFAASLAISNAVSPTNILGLDGLAVSNPSLSYLNAFDIIESTEMYAITVLTQSTVIHQLLKTHVEQMSLPENKKERIGLCNRQIVLEQEEKERATTNDEVTGARIIVNTRVNGEADFATNPKALNDSTPDAFLNVQPGDTLTIVSGDNVVVGETTVASKPSNAQLILEDDIISSASALNITYFINRKDGLSASATRIYDRDANYLSDGVAPGMFVRVFGADNDFAIGEHRITNVISNKEIEIEQVPGITSLVTNLDYEVYRELTKDEQAAIIGSYSSSIGSRRMIHLWPDELDVASGNEIVTVPGYFGCCAVGALVTGLPSQQGFTNLSISGYLGMNHGGGFNNYFKDSQLNVMADGGTFILQQDGDGEALYIRHQLTTDRSAIVFQELSLTKNIDFASKFMRRNYKSFIGPYNIVDTTLDDLKTRAKSILTYLSETTVQPKIGGVIRSGRLTRLIESETQPDTVLATFRCRFPFPLNNIDLTLEIE